MVSESERRMKWISVSRSQFRRVANVVSQTVVIVLKAISVNHVKQARKLRDDYLASIRTDEIPKYFWYEEDGYATLNFTDSRFQNHAFSWQKTKED